MAVKLVFDNTDTAATTEFTDVIAVKLVLDRTDTAAI
jgi:hypothetical protein